MKKWIFSAGISASVLLCSCAMPGKHEPSGLLQAETLQPSDLLASNESLALVAAQTPVPDWPQLTVRPVTQSDILMRAYHNWKGTPYQWGGMNKRGIDCSAFVMKVYENLGLQLPRTTYFQLKELVPVKRTAVRTGDLVFFLLPPEDNPDAEASGQVAPGELSRHVGIYLSHGRFMHASSSRGVTISEMNSFWRKHYYKARRVVLPDSNEWPPGHIPLHALNK